MNNHCQKCYRFVCTCEEESEPTYIKAGGLWVKADMDDTEWWLDRGFRLFSRVVYQPLTGIKFTNVLYSNRQPNATVKVSWQDIHGSNLKDYHNDFLDELVERVTLTGEIEIEASL